MTNLICLHLKELRRNNYDNSFAWESSGNKFIILLQLLLSRCIYYSARLQPLFSIYESAFRNCYRLSNHSPEYRVFKVSKTCTEQDG